MEGGGRLGLLDTQGEYELEILEPTERVLEPVVELRVPNKLFHSLQPLLDQLGKYILSVQEVFIHLI